MKNNYEIRGDVTAIFIDSPKYGMIETLISTSKLNRVKDFPNLWHLYWSVNTQSFYVYGNSTLNGKYTRILLHRYVTNAPKYTHVDHVNHETLNNTDRNLRTLTLSENQQNRRGANRNSKSGVRGVVWIEKSKKWQSSVRINGKQKYIGIFTDLVDAERAVIEARKNHMPYSKEEGTGA